MLAELIRDEDLSLDDIYFARHYFSFSDEELKAYEERCNIENCGGHVLHSSNIKNSNWVYNSTNIENSEYISSCDLIKYSTELKAAVNV